MLTKYSNIYLFVRIHPKMMLALQYKLLRISSEISKEYNTAFYVYQSRDKASLMKPSSVFEIALMNERAIPDLLRIIEVEESVISDAKKLIDNRNELAHAKGGIEREAQNRISKYLVNLKSIQSKMSKLNNKISSDWLSKMGNNEVEESEVLSFVELHLLESKLCQADFGFGSLKKHFERYINP